MKSLLICGVALWGGVVSLMAQEAPEAIEGDKKKLIISLLAVGDLPPIKYEATASGPVFIEPPKEDFPPPILYVKNKEKQGGFDQLRLGLNAPMPPIFHPGGKTLYIYEDKGAAVSERPESGPKQSYLKVGLPDEMVNLTVILARNPSSKSWRTTPRSYTFKNDLASFPKDSVRVINLSRNPVKGLLGATIFGLTPSGADLSYKVLPVAAKQNVLAYQVVGGIQGKAVPLANTATSFYGGTRLNMVIYDGDSKDTAGAMKVCLFAELPPVVAPDRSAATAGAGEGAPKPANP